MNPASLPNGALVGEWRIRGWCGRGTYPALEAIILRLLSVMPVERFKGCAQRAAEALEQAPLARWGPWHTLTALGMVLILVIAREPQHPVHQAARV